MPQFSYGQKNLADVEAIKNALSVASQQYFKNQAQIMATEQEMSRQQLAKKASTQYAKDISASKKPEDIIDALSTLQSRVGPLGEKYAKQILEPANATGKMYFDLLKQKQPVPKKDVSYVPRKDAKGNLLYETTPQGQGVLRYDEVNNATGKPTGGEKVQEMGFNPLSRVAASGSESRKVWAWKEYIKARAEEAKATGSTVATSPKSVTEALANPSEANMPTSTKMVYNKDSSAYVPLSVPNPSWPSAVGGGYKADFLGKVAGVKEKPTHEKAQAALDAQKKTKADTTGYRVTKTGLKYRVIK